MNGSCHQYNPVLVTSAPCDAPDALLHVRVVPASLPGGVITWGGGQEQIVVSIQAAQAAPHWYKLILSDSPDEGRPSLVKPTGSQTVVFEGFTNAAGYAEIRIDHTGPRRQWWVWCVLVPAMVIDVEVGR